jgi:hypothetical protein
MEMGGAKTVAVLRRLLLSQILNPVNPGAPNLIRAVVTTVSIFMEIGTEPTSDDVGAPKTGGAQRRHASRRAVEADPLAPRLQQQLADESTGVLRLAACWALREGPERRVKLRLVVTSTVIDHTNRRHEHAKPCACSRFTKAAVHLDNASPSAPDEALHAVTMA